jgi:hypothetical protein
LSVKLLSNKDPSADLHQLGIDHLRRLSEKRPFTVVRLPAQVVARMGIFTAYVRCRAEVMKCIRLLCLKTANTGGL